MKLSTLSKIVGVSAIAVSTAIVPLNLPASAQTTTTPGTGTEATQPGTVTAVDTQDDGFDWGWLGLIGLAGLAGLAGRKREEPARYRDPADRATTTGYRE